MKQKISNDHEMVTRGILREELEKLEKKFDIKLDEKFDEKLQNYPTKSEMFSRFDQIMGTLEQIREEILFHTHDIHCLKEIDADHEKRLKKLEPPTKN